jgi:hypothetical protein
MNVEVAALTMFTVIPSISPSTNISAVSPMLIAAAATNERLLFLKMFLIAIFISIFFS